LKLSHTPAIDKQVHFHGGPADNVIVEDAAVDWIFELSSAIAIGLEGGLYEIRSTLYPHRRDLDYIAEMPKQ